MPLDLQVVEKGTMRVRHNRRIDEDDPYFQTVSSSWGDALKLAFKSLPDFSFDKEDEA